MLNQAPQGATNRKSMNKIVTIAITATGLGLIGLGVRNQVKNGAPWRFTKKQESPAPAAAPANPAPEKPENNQPEQPAAAQAPEQPKQEDKKQ